MPDMIRDGSGKGFLAKINSDNQLITRATTVNQHTASTVDGSYYEMSTGQITLTDATETGILYIKPDVDYRVLVVDKVFFDVWASTAGVGGGILKYYKNPSVTGGTDVVPTNTNMSKAEGVDGTYKKSLTTMTGGTVWYTGYLETGASINTTEEKFCIPKGYGFGISVSAPTSNTSMKLSFNVAMYFLDEELIE